MNLETNSNKRIEVARTEDEMYEKLETLKAQGFAESDIHVISKDHSHISTLNHHSEVATHETGTFMDKFKSWFTGEDAVREGLRPLNLTEEEKERYSGDVARGGFVLYTESTPEQFDENTGLNNNELKEDYDTFGSTGNSYESYSGDNKPLETTGAGMENRVQTEDPQLTSTSGTNFVESRFVESENNQVTNETTTFGAQEPRNITNVDSKREEPMSEYAKEQGFEKSTNEFVNETDGRFDEPVDRFARGESFTTDPILARDTEHIGTSMQEDRVVQEQRPTNNERNENESITDASKTEGFQSPGADPNLGPAVFGDSEETNVSSENMNHDFDKDPRKTEPKNYSSYEEHQHGGEYTVDTEAIKEDEDITTDQYKERMDKDKYRGNNASSGSKLF